LQSPNTSSKSLESVGILPLRKRQARNLLAALMNDGVDSFDSMLFDGEESYPGEHKRSSSSSSARATEMSLFGDTDSEGEENAIFGATSVVSAAPHHPAPAPQKTTLDWDVRLITPLCSLLCDFQYYRK
jgi:hypothetical protein